MFLDDMAYLIEQEFNDINTLRFQEGDNLFLGIMLEEPDFCLSLYEYSGSPGAYSLGGGSRLYETPRFQAFIRNIPGEKQSTRIVMERIINLFDGITDKIINGTRYMRITAQGGPTDSPYDQRYRIKMYSEFEVMKYPTEVPAL